MDHFSGEQHFPFFFFSGVQKKFPRSLSFPFLPTAKPGNRARLTFRLSSLEGRARKLKFASNIGSPIRGTNEAEHFSRWCQGFVDHPRTTFHFTIIFVTFKLWIFLWPRVPLLLSFRHWNHLSSIIEQLITSCPLAVRPLVFAAFAKNSNGLCHEKQRPQRRASSRPFYQWP